MFLVYWTQRRELHDTEFWKIDILCGPIRFPAIARNGERWSSPILEMDQHEGILATPEPPFAVSMRPAESRSYRNSRRLTNFEAVAATIRHPHKNTWCLDEKTQENIQITLISCSFEVFSIVTQALNYNDCRYIPVPPASHSDIRVQLDVFHSKKPRNLVEKLLDRKALIVDGSSGIGFAGVEGALENGAEVYIAAEKPGKPAHSLDRHKAAYPGSANKVRGVTCDLANPHRLEANVT